MQRRGMHKWSAADGVLPQGGIKHYGWELHRMCKHADRDTVRWGDKDRERDGRRNKKCEIRAVVKCIGQKETQREWSYSNEEKGVKLTCPAAGRASLPSPGVGLAGLCSLPPASWPPHLHSRGRAHGACAFVNVLECVRQGVGKVFTTPLMTGHAQYASSL